MAQRGASSVETDPQIRVVHVIFKTHLDIGFTDYAASVVDRYMTRFIPAAMRLAAALREGAGDERFVWTTGSWLLYEYLERASGEERRRMEEAIAAGDVAWHGLPFTTHSELVDPSLFQAGLRLAQDLDARFGKRTIAAKMSDVPGHTRGIVPLLAAAGIRFLHIGVNSVCSMPVVPPVFVWRDSGGAEVLVMYDHTYGSAGTVVPGLDEAVAFAHTGDNRGPQSPEQVHAVFQQLRERFPGAAVVASTLDRFAMALQRVRADLPVVTQEIGDTWIHGVGADPTKIAAYRELARLRRQWLEQGRLCDADAASARFSRALLLVPEHTWGLDVKTHLADPRNHDAAAFQAVRSDAKYRALEASWAEQRAYVDAAIAALQDEVLEREAQERLAGLVPARPNLAGWTPVPDVSAVMETTHFKLRLDPRHGALSHLAAKQTGRVWVSEGRTLALVRYQTFSAAEYERFLHQYIVPHRLHLPMVRGDFAKPGLEAAQAEHRWWLPRLVGVHRRTDDAGDGLILMLAMPQEGVQRYGAPRDIVVAYTFPKDEPSIQIELQWFHKSVSRLPEAIWCSFVPTVSAGGQWRLDKMNEWVDPRDVIENGNRHLHAVDRSAWYRDDGDQLLVETPDAPLVAPGEPSLLDFNNRQPDVSEGIHVNLYNNVWGTNFPQWYGQDARFRFRLTFKPKE